ncbi:glycosyltransferase family 39 protein [Bacteroidia bacterium]|nr:glycosyltransferase family 39 protein [Bacteroidia bacterium]MDB4107002.1 glycosyltransferase family 39 protein [Bacteroidia bacterium]MDB9882462.1 glycosyltransferase family 39 protein [Bacteroidia bacterium]
MSRTRRYSVFIPFLFFIINVFLRWIGIEVNSLAGDEPFSVYFAQMEVPDILRHLRPGNNPPLYEVFLHFWEQFFGIGEVAVRIPSLIFTGITAAFMYKIGNEFFSKSVGIVAALLFTFSNYATYFSHEARVYALFGMLTSLSFYYFLRWLNDRYSVKTLVIFTILNGLLLYAHYFGIMVLGVQGGFAILFSFNNAKKLGAFALSILISLVLFGPYVPVVLEQFTKTKTDGTWLQPPSGWPTIEYMLMQFVNGKIITTMLLIIIGLGVILNLKKLHLVSKNTWVIIAWFVVPFFGMYFLSYEVPMFHNRYLMHTFVGFILLVSIASLSIIKMPIAKWIVPTVLIVGFVLKSERNLDNGRHTKEAVAKVQELRDADTRVVMFPKYRIFGYAYYFNIDRFKNFDKEYAYYDVLEGFKEENFYGINQYSEARIDSTVSRVVFLMTDGGPKEQLISEFEKDFNLTSKYFFPEIIDVCEFNRPRTE